VIPLAWEVDQAIQRLSLAVCTYPTLVYSGLKRKGRRGMTTTSDVLNNHLKCFGENDLDGVLADYSSDVVLFIPDRPLKGLAAIKPFFQAIFLEFAKPGASFTMRQRYIDGDYAYILWSAETADNLYELATDTFVVRNGKIVAQSFAAKITPKR
jgi:SnoaL-like domain